MEIAENSERRRQEKDEVKVKLKTLKAVMAQCQRTLEAINADGFHDVVDDDDNCDEEGDDNDDCGNRKPDDARGDCDRSSTRDHEAEELCDLIKSRLEGPDFLERIQSAQLSVQQNLSGEEGSSWDMVNDKDLWDGETVDNEQEEYVVVRQEDIVDGIACFMAAYLLSLEQTKDLTPNKLQEVLSKTFSIKQKKGKLQKALDGTKAVYNLASWSATAIGIYQNPALLSAATTAFWTSCRVISRLF